MSRILLIQRRPSHSHAVVPLLSWSYVKPTDWEGLRDGLRVILMFCIFQHDMFNNVDKT